MQSFHSLAHLNSQIQMKSKYVSYLRQKAFLHLQNYNRGQQDENHLLSSDSCELVLQASVLGF